MRAARWTTSPWPRSWVDTLIRLRGERTKPRRTVKLALTCGEETNGAFNGAEYLAKKRRDLIDAAFALNEGAWGMLDASGKRVMMRRAGGREDLTEFPSRSSEPGRPQLASGEEQCDLSPGGRAHAHRALRIPGQAQR